MNADTVYVKAMPSANYGRADDHSIYEYFFLMRCLNDGLIHVFDTRDYVHVGVNCAPSALWGNRPWQRAST